MQNRPKLASWRRDKTQPDVREHVDYKFEDSLHKFSARSSEDYVIDLRHLCSPVEDQSQANSCVGNAIVGALELLQIRDGVTPFRDLSRFFPYYNARLMTGDQGRDEGTWIRIAMGTLSSLGTCTEAKWPYDLSKVFVRPSWGAYREATPNRIDAYYKIGGSGETRIEFIRKALLAQTPVVFGMLVDQGFMETGPDGLVPYYSGKELGGHAMLIVGHDSKNKNLIVKNSWGPRWGRNGYCFVPERNLEDAEADDFWVPTLAPKNF